jgi:hypothetical protein
MVLSAGQRVAHYKIVSAVGAGGMGEVYPKSRSFNDL